MVDICKKAWESKLAMCTTEINLMEKGFLKDDNNNIIIHLIQYSKF